MNIRSNNIDGKDLATRIIKTVAECTDEKKLMWLLNATRLLSVFNNPNAFFAPKAKDKMVAQLNQFLDGNFDVNQHKLTNTF